MNAEFRLRVFCFLAGRFSAAFWGFSGKREGKEEENVAPERSRQVNPFLLKELRR